MIFITGDTHGDFTRFSTDIFPEQTQMTKDDYVIGYGDFGIWQDTPQERHWLGWLNDKSFTTLFVDGNHSNFDRLYQMPVSKWNGGQVHYIRDGIIHLMRGQIFEIAGKRVFTMGGAASHNISGGILEPDDRGICRNGLYRFSRNPMYVAYFIYFLGCVLLAQSVVLLLLVCVFQLSAH